MRGIFFHGRRKEEKFNNYNTGFQFQRIKKMYFPLKWNDQGTLACIGSCTVVEVIYGRNIMGTFKNLQILHYVNRKIPRLWILSNHDGSKRSRTLFLVRVSTSWLRERQRPDHQPREDCHCRPKKMHDLL